MQNLKALLNTLEAMKPYRPRTALTKFELIVSVCPTHLVLKQASTYAGASR